jgi:hypothetical protein
MEMLLYTDIRTFLRRGLLTITCDSLMGQTAKAPGTVSPRSWVGKMTAAWDVALSHPKKSSGFRVSTGETLFTFITTARRAS